MCSKKNGKKDNSMISITANMKKNNNTPKKTIPKNKNPKKNKNQKTKKNHEKKTKKPIPRKNSPALQFCSGGSLRSSRALGTVIRQGDLRGPLDGVSFCFFSWRKSCFFIFFEGLRFLSKIVFPWLLLKYGFQSTLFHGFVC